jgi:hypothetical protein
MLSPDCFSKLAKRVRRRDIEDLTEGRYRDAYWEYRYSSGAVSQEREGGRGNERERIRSWKRAKWMDVKVLGEIRGQGESVVGG